MKTTRIYFIILLVLFPLFLIAQDETTFGIKAGMNHAKFSENSGGRNGSSRWGFNGGFFLNHKISKYFAFQPEIYYSIQGQKTEYPHIENTEVTLQYLNVPLLMNIRAAKSIEFQFGPQVGFLLSGKEPIESNFKNYDPDFSAIDFSVCGGVVLDISNHVNVGARLNYGLTDVNYVSPFTILYITPNGLDSPDKDYNRVLHFFMSYTF